MHCPLGNHLLRGSGVFITNLRHIRFASKFFPDYLPSEKVCAKCKQDIAIAYEFRMKRALAMKARNGSLVSSYTSSESSVANSQSRRRNNVTNVAPRQRVSSSLTSTDDDQPTTSAQAAAKRKERDERHKRIQQQRLLPVNVQRGARLPHIQPVARRQQFVHINPDIMDIYLKGNMDSDTFHSLLESLSVEDGALHISSLIVHFLSQRFVAEYDWEEIENLVKMFVILNESISKHGSQFDQFSENDKKSFTILYNKQTNSGNFEFIAENILKSSNNLKSAVILDNILSHIKKSLGYELNLNACAPKIRNLNVSKTKMYAVIERIFVLPLSDIETSIETAIKNIDFEILGHVFCDTPLSIFFDKCTIVSDVICNKLENSSNSITNFFMPSLLMSLHTKPGKSLFLKCLQQNKQFRFSLNLYIKSYLISFVKNHIRPDTEHLLFGPMSFLMHLHFAEIDNNSLAIFSELNENNFLQDYLTKINLMYM